MKILFIAKNIPYPGNKNGNKIIYTIAKKLSNIYDVSFFFPKSIVPFGIHLLKKHRPLHKLKDWEYEGIKIKTIPFVQLPGLFCTYWLFKRLSQKAIVLFQKESPNLIHAHYGMPDGYLAYLLSKKFNVPYVLTLRNHDVLHLNKLKEWNPDYRKYMKVLKNASKILVPNGNLSDYFSKYGVDVDIMPHGIERSVFSVSRTRQKDDRIIITIVAEAIKRKNIDWVINAVSSYKGDRNLLLNIVGDGVELNKLKGLARGENNIVFLGKISHQQVLQELKNSDIFVLPSVGETFGLVYLEAAATQNAIIGCQQEGVWGIFEEGEDMLFSKNYDDFCVQLYHLLSDEKLRSSLCDNAFAKVMTMVWDKVIERYSNEYELILKD